MTRVLIDRRGVCQDFAHFQIACLRSLGLAARYVSGYLLTDPPPGQPRLIGADASHACLSVHCPHNGWVDLEPTNAVIADERHITIGWGRDYSDVSPLRGVLLGGAGHRLFVGVTVVPQSTDRAPQGREPKERPSSKQSSFKAARKAIPETAPSSDTVHVNDRIASTSLWRKRWSLNRSATRRPRCQRLWRRR